MAQIQENHYTHLGHRSSSGTRSKQGICHALIKTNFLCTQSHMDCRVRNSPVSISTGRVLPLCPESDGDISYTNISLYFKYYLESIPFQRIISTNQSGEERRGVPFARKLLSRFQFHESDFCLTHFFWHRIQQIHSMQTSNSRIGCKHLSEGSKLAYKGKKPVYQVQFDSCVFFRHTDLPSRCTLLSVFSFLTLPYHSARNQHSCFVNTCTPV